MGVHSSCVSYSKPFKPVSLETTRRWVKTVMEKPGIDVNRFKPHSTRAAATSKAFLKSVPLIEHILSDVGWSSSDTFAKFYKPVINTNSFLLFVTRVKAPNCFGYEICFLVFINYFVCVCSVL